MNRCNNCKNTRRQLLMLKCAHDICVKCAADNYFVNCKNKLSSKKSKTNNYFCERCLEQTQLDVKTIESLRKYFMDNVPADDKNKQQRREKMIQREGQQKQRLERIQRMDNENSQRPKSLQIEIANRKRTLSKYLNDKQVQKFIQMQNEYGGKIKHTQPRPQQRFTPQTHNLPQTPQSHPINEYELNRLQTQHPQIYQKDKRVVNDSFEKFALQQKYHNDYMRDQHQYQVHQRNSQRVIPQQPDLEYEIYRNGKGVISNEMRAAEILKEERRSGYQESRMSSTSSNKKIGTIRSKKSPGQKKSEISPHQQKQRQKGVLLKRQRISSYRSDDKLDRPSIRPDNKIISQYNTKQQAENTLDMWETQSKSTKRNEEKTVPHGEKNPSDTVEKILDSFEMAHRNGLMVEKSRSKLSPQRNDRAQIYFCKIHQDQEIIYFCLNCHQLICSQCALHGSHKSHQIHSLKKSAIILRQSLAQNVSTLTKLLIEEESKEKILKQCLNQLSIECSKQKQQIRSSFQNFIFHIDKKYKELLREIQDKFSSLTHQYSEKLIDARNNYLQIGRIKDTVCDTLRQCTGFEDCSVSQTNIGAACNQFGNFNIKRTKNKPPSHSGGIDFINKLTSRMKQLEEFLKSCNVLLFSSKKQSLLSENSSLRLSESSNLLQEDKNTLTPDTLTPQARSIFPNRFSSPSKKNKKIVLSSYSLNVKSRVKISQCQCIVESLLQMQEIVKSIRLQFVQYNIKALA